MSFIGAGLGELPIGGIADADSLAVTDPLTVIATADPPYKPSEYSYIVIARPYDFDTSSVLELRAANDGGPSNVSYSSYQTGTEPYAERVLRPYNFEARLPGVPLSSAESAQFLPGGSVTPTIGDVAWDNTDGALDDWCSYDWTDRGLEVYVGAAYAGLTRPAWPTEYAQIFNGRTDRAGWNPREFLAYIRDFRRRLAVPLQPTLYAGTGGLEGGDEIKGQPKPRCYGQVRQAGLILVDGPNHIYQLNDGSIQAVSAVRDSGAGLAFDANVADITTATPAPGEYATSLATGFIRLGEAPAGAVTVDAQGDNSGALGYVATFAGIIRKMATGPGGLTDPDELELGTFETVEDDVTYALGFYTGTEAMNVDVAMDRVADGARGWWTFTRIGRLAVGRVPADPSTSLIDRELPSTSTGGGGQQIETDADGFALITRDQASAPAYRVRLPYRRHWTTLDPANVAASVPETTRLDYGKEWRFASLDDAGVQTDVPSAGVVGLDWTLIDTPADAALEVARLLTLFSTERDFYNVTVWNPAFQYEVGQIVRLTAALYDLDAGRRFVAVGVSENPAQPNAQTQLVLWG